MPETTRYLLTRYGAAVGSVAFATGFRLLLDPLIQHQFPFALLFFTVLLSAWYGGFGPALTATVAGAFASILFLLPPSLDLVAQGGLVLYLVVGVGIALLGGEMHAARRRERQQREWFEVTLRSVGDAVVATDAQGRVRFLNAVAESLTGWSVTEASGLPVETVFRIVNESSGKTVENPVTRVLREGIVVGLANHTVLISRNGARCPIDDSAAPIRDASGTVAGVVLTFREVSGKRAGEERLRQLADSMPQIVYAARADGTADYYNRRWYEFTNLTEDQLSESTWVPFIHPDDLPGLNERWAESLRLGTPLEAELRLRDRNGVYLWHLTRSVPVRDESGRIARWYGTSTDIHQWKLSEEALRQTKRLLNSVIDYAPACIFAKQRDGRYLLANRALANLVGRDQNEFPGRTDYDFFPPEIAERFGLDDRAIIDSGQPRTYEESFVQDGVTRTYLTIKFPLRNAGGVPFAACAVATDITDLKRAREELQSTVGRLQLAFASARLGDWSWDASTDVVTLSERAAQIFGIPPGPHTTWTRMQELLHTDDRERTRVAVEEAVRDRTQYDIEYRLIRPNGSHIWVSALGRAQYSPTDEPIGMFGIVKDITERRGAEVALRESEERLRLALEAGRMGVWDWNIRTNEIRWSDNLESVHGLPSGTFPGTLEAFQNLIHPDDREFVNRAIDVSVEQRSNYDIEFRNVWPDGSIHWMAGKGKVYSDANQPTRMIGIGMDITERKRAEQDTRFLADASATLAALVDYESTLQKVAGLAVPTFSDWCAVDMLDENGQLRRLAVTHVDQSKVELAYELHRRFPPDPDATQGLWNIVRTGTSELVPEISDELLVASAKDAEFLRILRELGLKSYMGVPLRVRGRVLGAITFIAAESGRRYDAGDLVIAEDLAHRAAVAVENTRLYHEVREADRRKDEFLAILGHELRNPLAPISNALHILKLPGADSQIVEQAREMMERQVQHMVRLVDDLLDVSRIVRGKVDLRREPIELSAVVTRAVETSQPLIDSEGHELSVSVPNERMTVSGDLVRLAQVLGNLLNNAARYTERGGKIFLEAERINDRAVLRVRDTGIGIAPDVLPRIWDLFVQADRREKGSQGGMGIGLALVRGLVGLHGGTVEAQSEGLGKGSEFVVALPLLATEPRSDRSREEVAVPNVAPCRVLVVDDNVDAARSLAMLLRLGGHEVRVANDGPSALRFAEDEAPDLAFFDIGMPGMDGYELARQFRSHPQLRSVVLVALTGWGQAEDRRRTKEVGFDAHEVKPVSLEALTALLTARGRKV